MMNIADLQNYAVEARRSFHQFPEVGFTEFITTFEIFKVLSDMDFEIHVGLDAIRSDHRYGVPADEVIEASKVRAISYGVPTDFLERMEGGHTGVVAVMDTGRSGPHIAMRFDIDGLPIKESAIDAHLPAKEGFRSMHEGEMHACGHDGHISIGLAVARYIHAHRESLSGRYTIIFQPAEEGGRGARSVVAEGWLDDVDYFMSGHLGINEQPAGTVGATTDHFLASTKLDITFRGKSAHSGVEPNEGRNALLAAASASLQLHAIPRHRDGATRINVGRMEAGSGRNVIPDHAELMMETRGETNALNDYMLNEAKRILEASAALYGIKHEVRFMGKAIGAACSREWIDIVNRANSDNDDVEEILDVMPLSASEDVTFMIDHVQKQGGLATFMVFASPLKAGHHHPEFDFDEKAIRTAVSVFINNLVHLQNSTDPEGNEKYGRN